MGSSALWGRWRRRKRQKRQDWRLRGGSGVANLLSRHLQGDKSGWGLTLDSGPEWLLHLSKAFRPLFRPSYRPKFRPKCDGIIFLLSVTAVSVYRLLSRYRPELGAPFRWPFGFRRKAIIPFGRTLVPNHSCHPVLKCNS